MNLFLWLDKNPDRFWGVFCLACGMVLLAVIAPWRPAQKRFGWLRSPVLFSFLLLLAMAAFRWPVLLYNQRLNDPDEGQMMAGALTFLHQPEFWRHIDGTTHGPFVQLPLSAAYGIGLPADYTTTRFVGLLLVWGTIIFTWRTLASVCGEKISRLLILPLFCTAALTDFPGFVQYSSEHASMLLLAIATWAVVTAQQLRFNHTGARLFAGGIACAMVPFAKLQGAPMAALLGCWVALVPFIQRDGPFRPRLQFIWGWFGAGAGALLGVIAMYLTAIGAWSDFVAAYIVDNLTYTSARHFPWSDSYRVFTYLSSSSGGFDLYFYPSLGVIGFGLFSVNWREASTRRLLGITVGLFLATLYATLAPGRPHHHYLQLLIAPTGLLFGAVVGLMLDHIRRMEMEPRLRRETVAIVLGGMLLLTLVPQWHARLQGYGYLGKYTTHGAQMPAPEFASEVWRYAERGETMAIWGWMPWYYAELGLIQATREAHTERQIQNWSDRAGYRRRFLADLRESRPPIFIDAIGPGNFAFDDRAKYGHETFSELQAYIDANYQLIADADGSRVYARNDRIETRSIE